MEIPGKEVALALKLKIPAQPLLFCFSGVTPLYAAAEKLYGLFPQLKAELSLFRGRYYLAVHGALCQRRRIRAAASESGEYLGPASVGYAWYAEHGKELTRNALRDLGFSCRRPTEGGQL